MRFVKEPSEAGRLEEMSNLEVARRVAFVLERGRRELLRQKGEASVNDAEVSIPRQSRGLYDVSRSKRLLAFTCCPELLIHKIAFRFFADSRRLDRTLAFDTAPFFDTWE
jgi:hypothetical protein